MVFTFSLMGVRREQCIHEYRCAISRLRSWHSKKITFYDRPDFFKKYVLNENVPKHVTEIKDVHLIIIRLFVAALAKSFDLWFPL